MLKLAQFCGVLQRIEDKYVFHKNTSTNTYKIYFNYLYE